MLRILSLSFLGASLFCFGMTAAATHAAFTIKHTLGAWTLFAFPLPFGALLACACLYLSNVSDR